MATFVPLSTTDHADLKLRPLEDLNDFRNKYLIPVYGIEIGAVASRYPIVISLEDGDHCYSLSILCSVVENLSNMWITPNGKWRGAYIPACIRQGPFRMSLSEDDQRVVMEVKEVGEPLARVTIDKKIITFRKREKSPMPEDVITKLSAHELRDLVAFLASQKLKK